MIKCVVLYEFPPDAEVFEHHYFDVHLPLGAQIPGLRRREVAKATEGPGGQQPPYYRIAELYFDDRSSMEQAFASEQGRRASDDRDLFVTSGVTVFWAELDDLSGDLG
jgi:uncharacterized protein (TIGR02118 family)